MSALSFDQPPRSICLLRLSAIGDVTHMLPVVATLQSQWPETKITWIIGSLEYQLVQDLPNIEFIVFNKRNGVSEYLNLRKKLRTRSFDILLMMQVSLRANLISLLIKAQHKIGYDKSRARDFHGLFINKHIDGPTRVHVLDTFFQFLQKLGITERKMDWLISPDADAESFAKSSINDQPTAIINPCSSVRKNNFRNWPVENYAAIIDFLVNEKKMQVILTGGPSAAELEMTRKIIKLCKFPVTNLVGKTSLLQLLAVMKASEFIIAPDTGPAHMGTVAGIPVFALFASSNPLRTGPYNSQQYLINVYPEALKKFLHRSIDQVNWGQRVREPEVMSLISVTEVQRKISSLSNKC